MHETTVITQSICSVNKHNPHLDLDEPKATLLYAAPKLDHPVLVACRSGWIHILPPAIAVWIISTFGVTAVALRDLGLRDAEDLIQPLRFELHPD
jgi:hypothetical protein